MTDLRKAAEMALADWLANDEGVVRFGMELKTEWVSAASSGFIAGYELATLLERKACAQVCEKMDDGWEDKHALSFRDAILERSKHD